MKAAPERRCNAAIVASPWAGGTPSVKVAPERRCNVDRAVRAGFDVLPQ